MKKVLAIVLLTVFFVGAELQAQDAAKPELRTWKDSTGQFSVEAVFVRVSGDQVVLQRKDKTEISVPLAKLSAADRQYVQKSEKGEGPGGYLDKQLGLRFPARMGEFKFQSRRTYGEPRLGYSIRYQDDSLFKVDIYVYDNNIKNIGSGIDSKKIRDEFVSVLSIFSYMQQLGKYKDVKVVEKGQKNLGKTKYLWAQYEYKQVIGDGTLFTGSRLSDTYLVGKSGLFLKVRMTLKKDDSEKKKAAKDEFLKILGDLLESS